MRALCVPGLHIAKTGNRHDGSIDGHAPLRSGWHFAQDANLLAEVDLIHREVVLIEEPPDDLGRVQRLVLGAAGLDGLGCKRLDFGLHLSKFGRHPTQVPSGSELMWARQLCSNSPAVSAAACSSTREILNRGTEARAAG